jgi:antitoxin VapB
MVQTREPDEARTRWFAGGRRGDEEVTRRGQEHEPGGFGRSVVHIIDTYHGRWSTRMKAGRAKVFWTGRSQAVRLPKEYRFDTDTVSVRREGAAVILEPANEWPEGYVESFTGMPDDFRRPEQGEVDEREKLV